MLSTAMGELPSGKWRGILRGMDMTKEEISSLDALVHTSKNVQRGGHFSDYFHLRCLVLNMKLLQKLTSTLLLFALPLG